MDAEHISTRSVSLDVAETDPIVLRESDTQRLVFLPSLVDRPEDPVRGCFVYQRKLAADTWQDIRGHSLTSLKAGEGWTLELRSAEVSRLMEGLTARRALYERHGIVWGEREFVSKDSLPQVVRAIIEYPDSELAEVLGSLSVDEVVSLGRKVDLSKLDTLLSEWHASKHIADESHWQRLLAKNTWVLSQLTGSPVVLLHEKAYIGGKGIENTGGGEIDYLVRNALTDNVSFIEIKTPATPIYAAAYRTSGSFALDKEISGGIVQVLGYRERFEKTFYPLLAGSQTGFQKLQPAVLSDRRDGCLTLGRGGQELRAVPQCFERRSGPSV